LLTKLFFDQLGTGMTRRSRIGQRQLEDLQHKLTDTDWQVLQDVAHFRLMTTHQVQHLHFGHGGKDERRCQRQLAQLVEQAVLDRLPRRVGGRGRGSDSTVYRVGRAGKRLIRHSGGPGPAWQPSAAFAAHTLGIVDIYVELVGEVGSGHPELNEFTPEPEAWRQFTWQMKPLTLKPDAFTVVKIGAVEHHYFIELDLGTESMTAIENKINRYLDYYRSGPDLAVFPQVLFLIDSAVSYHSRGTVERVEQITKVASATLPGDLEQLVIVCAKNHPPWAIAEAA